MQLAGYVLFALGVARGVTSHNSHAFLILGLIAMFVGLALAIWDYYLRNDVGAKLTGEFSKHDGTHRLR